MHATTPKLARRPLDPKLPRERVVHGAPFACRHCGSMKIRKLDEKITKTLAPSHPIARGRAGPQLLAEELEKEIKSRGLKP